jgi:hypothetical protein
MMTNSWIAEILDDPEDPESLILQFPDELLEKVGWKTGDTLIWEVQEDDSIIIRKK